MNRLSHHPFPVEAFLEKSLVLGFALPESLLRDRIPECLELDTFRDQWAFVVAAMVDTRQLRPKGFPRMLGRDFILIGYRIFVRYRTMEGRRLRGLYILGSETDSRVMKMLGGVFTRYRYTITSVNWTSKDGDERIVSSGGLRVTATRADEADPLPEDSPFTTWAEARRFAGPMPYTFSYDSSGGKVTLVEGIRSEWSPTPVTVDEWQVPFLDRREWSPLRLANAFMVERVPYQWKSGVVERWKT